MSPDAKWVASGSSDGSLKIWDVTADKVLANFAFQNQSVTCLQFNPKTLTMANGSSDRTIKYWDLEKMANITKTNCDTSGILHLAFSGDNPEHLFACS
jgi:katanin p80 WD40 repeat-containing subunit B1